MKMNSTFRTGLIPVFFLNALTLGTSVYHESRPNNIFLRQRKKSHCQSEKMASRKGKGCGTTAECSSSKGRKGRMGGKGMMMTEKSDSGCNEEGTTGHSHTEVPSPSMYPTFASTKSPIDTNIPMEAPTAAPSIPLVMLSSNIPSNALTTPPSLYPTELYANCFGMVTGDVFGNVRYFNDGKPLIGGSYTVIYVDGCMKFNPSQAWAVHAFSCCTWSVVELAGQSTNPLMQAPGTGSYNTYTTYEECVQANQQIDPISVVLRGETIVGIQLDDLQFDDNVEGEVRNPSWVLCPNF